MGLFDLFKAKTKGEVKLEAQPSALPGQTIPVKVHFSVDEETTVNQIRLELEGQDTYTKKETTYDQDRGSQTETQTCHAVFATVKRVIAETSTLPKGFAETWQTEIQAPADAIPSAKGADVNVYWKLRAVVDVPKRKPMVSESLLQMLAPRSAGGSQIAGAQGKEANRDFGDCTLAMTLEELHAAPGGTFKGELRVDAAKSFKFRALRAELVKIETAGDSGSSKAAFSQGLLDETTLAQGESRRLPFVLSVPKDAAPNVRSPNSSLRWEVRVVIDRPMAKDFILNREVPVYNAPT